MSSYDVENTNIRAEIYFSLVCCGLFSEEQKDSTREQEE